jgi:hypothetical protein
MKEDKVLEGVYEWSADEVARAGMWHYRSHNRWMGRWLAVVLLIVVCARLILAIVNHEPFSVEIGFMLLLLVIALLSLLIPLIVKATIRMNSSKRPEQGKTVTLRVSTKEITIEMDGFPTTTYGWDKLQKVVQTRDGLLCYANDASYQWLPFHAFNKADADTLLEFARQYPEKLKEIR